MKRLGVVILVTLTGCGPFPPPQPPTPPPPTPPPVPAVEIRGARFFWKGEDIRMGGSVAGSVGDEVGWPCVSVEVLDEIKAAGLNYTECRTGPFTAEAETPQHAFYAKAPNGKYDLTKFNPDMIGLYRTRASQALERGIILGFDLPMDRWVVQHKVSPWQKENNLQGEEHGGLVIFQSAPDPVHETALRWFVSQTCEFPNVIYLAGNEAFKSDSHAWSSRVVAIVRELCPGRPIGGNSPEGAAVADFTVFHQNEAPQPVANGHPVLVDEFEEPAPSINGEIAEAVKADRLGTYYIDWKGPKTPAQWRAMLKTFGDIRAGRPVPTPPPPICARPDFEAPGWALVCKRKFDPEHPTIPVCPTDQHLERIFAPNIQLANSRVTPPSHEAGEAEIVAYLDNMAGDFQRQGICAWHDHDAVMAKHTDGRWFEEHPWIFISGELATPENAFVGLWTPPGGPTPAPTPTPGACPANVTGTNWAYVLKANVGTKQLDLTAYVANPTGRLNEPWGGCGTVRCPLAKEHGDVAFACQLALFGTPIWGKSGGDCKIVDPKTTRSIIPLDGTDPQPFTIKVAEKACALFVRGTVSSSPLSQGWEVHDGSPACQADANNVCH